MADPEAEKFPQETSLTAANQGGSLANTPAMLDSELDGFFDAQDENTRAGEARIHRLAIAQPGTPEVSNQVPGYKAGQILDNRTRQVLSTFGPPPWMMKPGVPATEIESLHYLHCALIMKLPIEYTKWKTQLEQKASSDGVRWHFRTFDVTEPQVQAGVYPQDGGKWGRTPETAKLPPPVTVNTNFALLPLEPNGECKPLTNYMVASFNRTSSETGRLIVDYTAGLRINKQVPWCLSVYLWMKRETDGTNTWYEYRLATAGGHDLLKANPYAYQMCKALALQLSDKTHGRQMQLAILNAAEEQASGGGADANAGADAGGIQQPNDPFKDDEEGEGGPPKDKDGF